MRILFINFTNFVQGRHPRHILPPLDIGYCASLLDEKDYKTELLEIIEVKHLQQTLDFVESEKIDVIVLKPFLNPQLALKLATKLERFVRCIIVMGPVASLSPHEFIFKNSPVDFCVIGEPEFTVLELIDTVQNKRSKKNVRGIAFFSSSRNKLVKTRRRKLIKNLDRLPFPKHSFFLDGGYNFFYPVNMRKKMKISNMLASRGCPYNCLFCSPIERVSYEKKFRVRSAKNVVDEMQFLKKIGVNAIYFRDDCFNVNKKWVIGFCDEIISRGLKIKWVAQCRVDLLDEKILTKMKEAGCSTVCLGVESGSDRILSILNKGVTVKKMQEMIKLIDKIGIWIVCFFIIGNPSETESEMKQTFRFAKQLLPDMIQLHFFTPYPGSLAFKSSEAVDGFSKFWPLNSFSQMNIEKLKKFQKYFYRKYYFNPRFIKKFIFRSSIPLIKNYSIDINLIKTTLKFLL